MRMQKTLMLPKFTEIESLKQAKEVIVKLTKVIERQNQYIYGDLLNHEERITALEP